MEEKIKDRIAILIVTYNALDSVRISLDKLSWIEQEENVEVFLVDNNSDEPVVEFVKKEYPWIKVESVHSNTGFASGMNEASLIASPFKPAYYLLVNPDLIIEQVDVERLYHKAVTTKEKVGIIGPRVLDSDGQVEATIREDKSAIEIGLQLLLQLLGIRKRQSPDLEKYSKEQYVDSLSGACLLVNKQMADEIGFFDSDYFMYHEDDDLAFRARKAGWRVLYFPDVEVTHARGKSSEKHPERERWHKERMLLSMLIYFKKNKGDLQFWILKMIWYANLYLRILLNKDRVWAKKMLPQIKEFKLKRE